MNYRKKRRKKKRTEKIILVMVAIILGVVGWFIMLDRGLHRALLNPDFYLDLGDRTGLFPRIHDLIFDEMIAGNQEIVTGESVVLKAVEETFTVEWLRERSRDVLEEMVHFLRGEEDHLLISLELHERQALFQEKLIAEIRAHSPPQLKELGMTDLMIEEFLGKIELPPALILAEISIADVTKFPGADFLFRQKIFRHAPYLLFVLLVVLFFIRADYLTAFKWIGGSMLASGLGFMAMYLAGRTLVIVPLLKRLLEKGSLNRFFPDTELFLRAINDSAMFTRPVVFVLTGLVLLIVGIVFIRKNLAGGRGRADRHNGESLLL
ncbi:MAG: hypothetical protein GX364_05565 [Firmicutes bacterium]|jgi:hypothetical protein|nr:hypothetical protein [Bacillota bacterium]